MALTQFEDLPSTNTPLNATNLNTMVDAINNKVQITKLWNNGGTYTSWENATLGIDVSGYDFLLLVTSHQTIFVRSAFDSYLSWNGYYSTASKDVVVQRHIYRDGNDIRWGDSYYRGINGATGADRANDIDYPIEVYGIKIGD